MQRYVLHPDDLYPLQVELLKMPRTVILLEDSMSEAEIRGVLVERFGELTGIYR